MKYRDRNEIVKQILTSCLEPKTKTKIMYNAYLSYTQVQYYVEYCLKKELIEQNGNGTYHITGKGRDVIDLQNKLFGILGELPN